MSDIPRLELKDLTRHYDQRAVVNRVSLRVMPGQVTCLLGPSGCGKSTTLRMVAGVERQDRGEILVDGKLICDGHRSLPPDQRQIGLMFQDFALFPHLKVAENVGFGLKGNKTQAQARIRDLLSRVGLAKYENAFPHELSGGEQQRVALARALAPKPSIMLMDEPFSGLDNRLRDGIRDDTLDILRSEETAVLLVTHEPDEAMRMADQIALMRTGKIVQQGTPETLYKTPVDRDSVAFFSDVNVWHGTVKNGAVETGVGRFPANNFENGTSVDVIARPQHMTVAKDTGQSTGADAILERSRFMGATQLLELRLTATGDLVKLTQSSDAADPNLGEPGTALHVSVAPQDVFIFRTHSS